jgi:hypothetical protein
MFGSTLFSSGQPATRHASPRAPAVDAVRCTPSGTRRCQSSSVDSRRRRRGSRLTKGFRTPRAHRPRRGARRHDGDHEQVGKRNVIARHHPARSRVTDDRFILRRASAEMHCRAGTVPSRPVGRRDQPRLHARGRVLRVVVCPRVRSTLSRPVRQRSRPRAVGIAPPRGGSNWRSERSTRLTAVRLAGAIAIPGDRVEHRRGSTPVAVRDHREGHPVHPTAHRYGGRVTLGARVVLIRRDFHVFGTSSGDTGSTNLLAPTCRAASHTQRTDHAARQDRRACSLHSQGGTTIR